MLGSRISPLWPPDPVLYFQQLGVRGLAGNLSECRCSGIRRLGSALQVVEESVSIGEWKEDCAVVLGGIRSHCEGMVGQLVVTRGVGIDGERIWSSPLLASDDRTQPPDCV